ncbi:MAG: 3-methyl-2-oxobutanoate hydroxymethyltransferase [Myxococcales bacterium]|nr:3-methyl-2-oxobutanoate hydroxymethyltransferase [Myxococcales bacterium]
MRQTVTIRKLQKAKRDGRRISMVTAYDATFARLIDQGGADAILVGDSLGNVIQGHGTTLPVTLEHMIYHCAAVMRGVTRAHVVGDMPFISYRGSEDDAVHAACRLMAEGGVNAVKLEGGRSIANLVARLTTAGIPVMGHLGLTPQSVHQLGGFRVQGRAEDDAQRLLEDARILEESGAYAIVLEMVPQALAREVTEALTIPTIGIGAGPDTDGQVLVCYDLLGMNLDFQPKFLKKYANLGEGIQQAIQTYCEEVQSGAFPADEHSF